MISISPFGDSFTYLNNEKDEIEKIKLFVNNNRKNVVVQGIGFVGAAMMAALANASDQNGNKIYNVIGIDLCDEKNYWKIALTNKFIPPIRSTDPLIAKAYKEAKLNSNLMASYTSYAYSIADVIVIDIHLDIDKQKLGDSKNYKFSYSRYIESLKVVSDNTKENTLVVIETTVPPGTTENKIVPLFKKSFKKNNLNFSKLYLSHSYERVMPGFNYLNSIINYFRVYSGINKESKLKAKVFFESFINTKDFPLSELHSTNASEISKVLENSYRSTNIAFIKEWTTFAESANVNLFEVINSIKLRDTHNNIMYPGFGVGGYCLTKDALLADWSYRNLFHNSDHLNMSINSVQINDLMPEHTFKILINKYKSIKNKKILILGVSYINDVFDTRYSPTEYLYDMCIENGSKVFVHDTITSYWEEKDLKINTDIESLNMLDCEIAIFAVKHSQYLNIDFEYFIKLLPNLKMVIDANNVLNDSFANSLAKKNILIYGVGKGHWNKINK